MSLSTADPPPGQAGSGPLVAEREPRGYLPRYGLASFGLFLAILAPVLGGLAIKIQNLNHGDLDASASQLALVTGVGALFALFCQPLVGRLSDRTTARMGQRKPWIITGVVGAAASLALVGFAPNIVLVLIGWCLAQTFSNFAQAAETATVPDQVPVARRGVVSGIVGACTPLAILAGAVGLAQLPTDQLRFLVPAGIGLVLGLWFALGLKDKVITTKPGGPLRIKEFFSSFVFNPRKHPDLGWAWLTKFLVMFGYASVGTYLVLFLAAKFDMVDTGDQAQFNMYANFVSVGCMVIFSVLGGRLSDKIGRRRAFVALGGLLTALGVAVIAMAPFFGISAGLVVILVGEAFLGGGGGLFFAVDMALCTEVLPNPDDTAKDLGVLNIANALPQSLAPLFAGPLINLVNGGSSGGVGYTVWFLIGAAVATAGGILVYRIKGVK